MLYLFIEMILKMSMIVIWLWLMPCTDNTVMTVEWLNTSAVLHFPEAPDLTTIHKHEFSLLKHCVPSKHEKEYYTVMWQHLDDKLVTCIFSDEQNTVKSAF